MLEFLSEKLILRSSDASLSGLHGQTSHPEVKIMARAKRSSPILETARRRLAGLKSITPAPDFGPNLKLDDYEKEMDALEAKIAAYNEKLAALDSTLNEIKGDEVNLRHKNVRMLSATGAQYGPDSSEYEQAGGTRTSERKRPTKKATKKSSTPTS
jgi:hypothetical protein